LIALLLRCCCCSCSDVGNDEVDEEFDKSLFEACPTPPPTVVSTDNDKRKSNKSPKDAIGDHLSHTIAVLLLLLEPQYDDAAILLEEQVSSPVDSTIRSCCCCCCIGGGSNTVLEEVDNISNPGGDDDDGSPVDVVATENDNNDGDDADRCGGASWILICWIGGNPSIRPITGGLCGNILGICIIILHWY
jgi:hypothetical protein